MAHPCTGRPGHRWKGGRLSEEVPVQHSPFVGDDVPFASVLRRQRMRRPPYRDEPVDRELLTRVLAAGRKAPSAGFTQGARFLVLEGEQVPDFFRTTYPPGTDVDALLPCPVVVLPLQDADAYVARYAEPDKAAFGLGTGPEAWPVPYWTVDSAFATMNVLLSATAAGLGAWFFGIFAGERELLDSLGVPAQVSTIGAFTIGHLIDDAPSSGSVRTRERRAQDDTIRWGRW